LATSLPDCVTNLQMERYADGFVTYAEVNAAGDDAAPALRA
jgi:hypothetical protein